MNIKLIKELVVAEKELFVAVDGACSMNATWTGGWSYFVVGSKGKYAIKYGHEMKSTNNRMEVMAIIEVLKDILGWERKNKKRIKKVTIISDSGYAVFPFLRNNWIDKWRDNKITAEKTKNYDLWKEAIPLVMKFSIGGGRIEFVQIRGHGKDKLCTNKTRDCLSCFERACSSPVNQYYNAVVDYYAVMARLIADGKKVV